MPNKLARAKARLAAAHTRAKSMFGTAKPYLKSGAGGAVAFYGQQYAAENFDFVKNNYWGGPALILGVGVLAGRRGMPDVGHGLAGAAGYALAFNYALKKFQDGKSSSSPVGMFAEKASGAPSVKGWEGSGEASGDPFGSDTSYLTGGDSGAPVEYRDAGDAGAIDDTSGDWEASGDGDVSAALGLNVGGGTGNEMY
jgi:hypothetical protein